MWSAFRQLAYLGEVYLTIAAVGVFWFTIGALIMTYPLWAAAFVLSGVIVLLVNVV